VNGTTDWNEYSVSVPAVPAAKILTIQLFFSGTGKAWFDDLQLLVDGKPVIGGAQRNSQRHTSGVPHSSKSRGRIFQKSSV